MKKSVLIIIWSILMQPDLVAQIKAPAELRIIKGAGHFFDNQLDELKAAITEWVLGEMG